MNEKEFGMKVLHASLRLAGIGILLSLMSTEVRGQVVIVRMIDLVNDKEMFRGNSIHEAGFNMIREDQERVLKLQTYISFYTNMLLRRETEKMDALLNIDDFFSGNTEWQQRFLNRADQVRKNLGDIELLIANFPRTSRLAAAHSRLVEDLEDVMKKYNQVIGKDGQENMMRNDERNHLGILAEDGLEQVARLTRDLYNVIPQTRKEIMKEDKET